MHVFLCCTESLCLVVPHVSFTIRRFFGLGQALLLGKLRISQTKSKHNQRDRQTNSRNAQEPLGCLVGKDHFIPGRGANGVCSCKHQWLRVNRCSECLVSESAAQLSGEHLVPDGTGDGVTEGTSDIVRCEEDASDDSEI